MLDRRGFWLRGLRKLSHQKRGVTALEYSLIAGLIAIAIVTGVTAMGSTLNGFFSTFASAFP